MLLIESFTEYDKFWIVWKRQIVIFTDENATLTNGHI